MSNQYYWRIFSETEHVGHGDDEGDDYDDDYDDDVYYLIIITTTTTTITTIIIKIKFLLIVNQSRDAGMSNAL